jgi:hypothetical protein
MLSKDLGVLWVGLGVCIAQYSKIWFCTGKLARVLHASDVICYICTVRPDSELSSVGKLVVALRFEYVRRLLAGSVFTAMDSIPS